MTTLTGTVKTPKGNLNGRLLISSNHHQFTEDEHLLLGAVNDTPIIDGVISGVDLEPNLKYRIRIQYNSGNNVYDTLVDFESVIPDVPSININEILKTPITQDTLDTAVVRLAKYLMGNSTYYAQLKTGFRYRGDFDIALTYFKDDVVNYDGGSFIYFVDNPQVGINPYDNTVWFQLGSKGDDGVGTTGNDTPYDATGWNGQTDAPSRNAIRDLVENTLVTDAEVSGLAPLSNPVFTNPSANTPSANSNDTSLLTSEWFWQRITPVLPLGQSSALLTGTPSAVSPPTGNNSGRIATTAWSNELMDLHIAASDPHNAQSLVNSHVADIDPHNSELFTINHEAAPNPHPQYATPADITTHEATNNHPALDVLTATGWVWGTGWSDFGGTWQGLTIKKVGSLVTINGFIKRTSGTTNISPITGIPVAYRPSSDLMPIILINNSTGVVTARAVVDNTGAISVYNDNGDSLTSLTTVINWLSINCAYHV